MALASLLGVFEVVVLVTGVYECVFVCARDFI